jgi:hypothetical protein
MGFDVLSPVGIRLQPAGPAPRDDRTRAVGPGAVIGILENGGPGHSIDPDEVRAEIRNALGDVTFLTRRKPNRSFEMEPDGIREFAACAAVVCATAE